MPRRYGCGVALAVKQARGVRDIDLYMDGRTPGLRRKSLKDYAERLRSLLRYMHRTGYVASNLAVHVIGPLLYAYEGVPSILDPDQITAVLETTKRDTSPIGLHDYAILQLLATFGLRSGEIRNLTIEDIHWRSESLRVRHSKTGACSFLPLLAPVGEALLDYLRDGRPRADRREVFLRSRAPYRPLRNLHSEVHRRLLAAGVKPPGKCGPHIFRHARAVEMLRASVPQKIIGDLLGHRSTEATIPYLKLATEDLRSIALDVPGSEVLARPPGPTPIVRSSPATWDSYGSGPMLAPYIAKSFTTSRRSPSDAGLSTGRRWKSGFGNGEHIGNQRR